MVRAKAILVGLSSIGVVAVVVSGCGDNGAAGGPNCGVLAVCCVGLPAGSQTTCTSVSSGGDDSACSAALGQLKASGYCGPGGIGVDMMVGVDVPKIPNGMDMQTMNHPDVQPGTDTPVTMTPDMPPLMGTVVTIPQIQNINDPMHPAPGTTVTIKGVIAMSPKTFTAPSKTTGCLYGIWVADPAGGPFSGINVSFHGNDKPAGMMYCPNGNDPLSGGAIPETAQVGDTFDITGEYEEFILSSGTTPAKCAMSAGAPCTATYAQISDPRVGNVSAVPGAAPGTPPAPNVLTADDITALKSLGQPSMTSDEYRGSLVELDNVTVSCPAVDKFGNDAIDGTTCMPSTDSSVEGIGDGLWIHRHFDFPYNPMYMKGDMITKLVGLLDYDQFSGHWLIVPRSDADVTK